MKQYQFSVVRNASDTKIERMSAYDIRQLTNRINRETIGRIRVGNGELKRALPAVCWGAEFLDGRRRMGENGQNIKDSFLRFIDIDHISNATTPEQRRKDVIAYYEQRILPAMMHHSDMVMIHVQVSPSGDGLHVVWTEQDGTVRSMEESQARFAKICELPSYDDKCKDQGRMLFLSPIEDTLFDLTDLCME